MTEFGNPQAMQSCRGSALVVDDEATNRMILKSLLVKHGYQVIEARDGAEAVNLFDQHKPDFIFMDVMMPVMDGYEAAERIKSASAGRLVPLIFLTAISEEAGLAKCIDAGGDDFLTKPFSATLLKAKIRSLERIRDLHREVSELYGRMHHEEEIAERVFSEAVVSGNVQPEGLHTVALPAGIFSGDMLLTAHAPSRDLHVMLGDFTGHGLAAALGALPASEVFRAMTAKGFPPAQIMAVINRKMQHLLPTGMFLAAGFVAVSHDLKYCIVCNRGLPEILVVDGKTAKIRERVASSSVPLGIVTNSSSEGVMHKIPIQPGDRILLASDGVTEAMNSAQEMFGIARFEQTIQSAAGNESTLRTVAKAVEAFCDGTVQVDDITLAEILCRPEVLAPADVTVPRLHPRQLVDIDDTPPPATETAWEFSCRFVGARLANADPVPLVINHLQELEGLQDHRQAIFTILTELFVNALDHGILGLDSALKTTPEGFAQYFVERDSRLEQVQQGEVSLNIRAMPDQAVTRLVITVADSGPGFAFDQYLRQDDSDTAHSGRGIRIVRALCEAVSYQSPGNRVEAVYAWENG